MSLNVLILSIILPILSVCLILATVRIVQGPHVLDRVLALDFMIVVGVGMLGLYAVASDQPTYLDAAIVVTLLSFLGTIGFAYYVELRGTQKENVKIQRYSDSDANSDQLSIFTAQQRLVEPQATNLAQHGEPS